MREVSMKLLVGQKRKDAIAANYKLLAATNLKFIHKREDELQFKETHFIGKIDLITGKGSRWSTRSKGNDWESKWIPIEGGVPGFLKMLRRYTHETGYGWRLKT
jgi:hypothetical protein